MKVTAIIDCSKELTNRLSFVGLSDLFKFAYSDECNSNLQFSELKEMRNSLLLLQQACNRVAGLVTDYEFVINNK